MSALPKPPEMDAHTRRRFVRALLVQAALWAPTICKSSPTGRTPPADRWPGPETVTFKHRIPALADAASDAALNGSANCFWPTSGSEVAATERFGWYCIAKLPGKASFRSSLSLSLLHFHHYAKTRAKLVAQMTHEKSSSWTFVPRKQAKVRGPSYQGSRRNTRKSRHRNHVGSCAVRGPS